MSLDSVLAEIGHDLEGVLEAFVRSIVGSGGRTLLSMADTAVRAVEADPTLITSATKRDAAFGSILAAAEAGGLAVLKSAVSAAIEVAVAALKAELGPVGLVVAPLIDLGATAVEGAVDRAL